MTDRPKFLEWLAAQDTVPPGLNADLFARIKAALPNDPETTGLARGEADLWMICGRSFPSSKDTGVARLTLRRLIAMWQHAVFVLERKERLAERKRQREQERERARQ